MVRSKDAEAYRRDAKAHGQELSALEREELVKKYLPTPPPKPNAPSPTRPQPRRRRREHKPRVRPLLKQSVYTLLYYVIQFCTGVHIRLRHAHRAIHDRILGLLYYHHRTPELIKRDVKPLRKLPEHLSVILHLRREEDGGLERLLDEVAEISAWCASANIPMLSVYERTGILKAMVPRVRSTARNKFDTYFGPSPNAPLLKVTAPNSDLPAAGESPASSLSSQDSLVQQTNSLILLLLSEDDGRETLVDLTKTLAEMAQKKKIAMDDITQELVDAEVSETMKAPFYGHPQSDGFGAGSGARLTHHLRHGSEP